MLEDFSRSYYLGRFRIEPWDGELAAMDRGQHERANERVYATGDGIERLDNPLIAKLDTAHFAIHGSPDVPPDTIALPSSFLDDIRGHDLPAIREVLLAKADRAGQLLRLFGADLVRNVDAPR